MTKQPNNTAPERREINPQEAARVALQFLQRVQMTPAERQAYDVAEMLLQAIGSGRVQIVEQPQPEGVNPAPPADIPAAGPAAH